MIPLNHAAVDVETISANWLTTNDLQLDVLRLDKIHPIVSGNKGYKLKYYLRQASKQGADTIGTFGGAWSNHIAATAYIGKMAGVKTVGVIRGEPSATPSSTLQQAKANGMQLIFASREAYRNKQRFIDANPQWYWISEGGYGQQGAVGAAEILQHVKDLHSYSCIVAAVGTGTMLAGLINASFPHQHVIGISSMKGNLELEKNIRILLNAGTSSFHIEHDFHFGGYGKHPQPLIDFINDIFTTHQLPLDIVYTGKTFFAIQQLALQNRFPRGSKMLMIHSGGLQGNKSLGEQVLAF